MAKYRVVVVEKLFETFEEEKTVLSSVDADLEVFDCRSRDELIAAVQDAHGLLLHHIVQIDDGIIREMKRWKQRLERASGCPGYLITVPMKT